MEFLSAIEAKMGKGKYPTEEIDAIWKLVLLNQFHDILPGSSINQVYADSAAHYEEITQRADVLREQAAKSIGGGGKVSRAR